MSPNVGDNGAVDAPDGIDANSTSSDDAVTSHVVFNAQGLVPVVVQEADTLAVLMLAWMDEEALRRTRTTGRATYWSRSRQEYWVKGETSGNTQHVVAVRPDCDGDTLLLTVQQTGPACHTGATTCFDASRPLPISSGAGR